MAFLPEARVRKLSEQILKLLSLDNNMLVQASLQTLKVSRPVLPPATYKATPLTCLFWCAVAGEE